MIFEIKLNFGKFSQKPTEKVNQLELDYEIKIQKR